jgi:outer membrane protein assembly factor BamB
MRGSLAPLLLVLLSIGVQDTHGQQPETAVLPEAVHPWPMYGHDSHHGGRTALVGPQTSDVAWRLVDAVDFASAPAVAADGTVYIAASDKTLRATAPDGTPKWAFQADEFLPSRSPAIGDDGTVYIGDYPAPLPGPATLYAINPDGTLRWTFGSSDGFGTVTIGPNGTIYVASGLQVHAINADGTERWRFFAAACSQTGCSITSQPVALGPDGSVYFHANGGFGAPSFFFALNPDGTLRWLASTGGSEGFAPSVCASSVCRGTIYFALGGPISEPDGLIAIRPNGSVKWGYEVGEVTAGTSIAPDGTVYLPASNSLHAVNPDGTLRWAVGTEQVLRDRPAVGGDGTIYVNGDFEDVYAFNADGTLKWLFEATDANPKGVAIGPHGRLYFGADEYLFALGE